MKIPTSLTKLSAIAALAIILSTINAGAATFTVTNKNDSGAGSLRQAVLDANAAASADTIVFDATFFSTARTITLLTEIAISSADNVDHLTITGPGADLLTITCTATNRIFTNGFTNGGTDDVLSISGMTLTRSGTQESSFVAVQNAANLTVDSVVFSSISGGGIDNTNNISPSSLTVANSVFSGNSASSGAAINNSGAATITNSTFTSNTAGNGGAIAHGGNTSNGGSLMVTGCTFTNNTATSNSATGLGGGAIYSSSDVPEAVVTISGSTFTGNAEVGAGGGGAVNNRSGSMTIGSSIFTKNSSVISGGAINNRGILSISGSTISDNSATGIGSFQVGTGGAISNQNFGQITIATSVITGNSATSHGGGIYYQPNGGTPLLTITNTTISNNTANSNNDTTGDGGGLHIAADAGGVISISGSTFSGNQVLGAQTGGGIHAEKDFDLTNCTVSGNSAGTGGGVFITNVFGSAINFTNSTIAKNTATVGQGGGVFYHKTFDGLSVNLSNSIFADNVASTNPDLVSEFGSFNSKGFNFIENASGATFTGDTTTNITGVDPLLAPAGLQDNGGLTQTIALQANSPAIDKGNSFGLKTDQRGLLRPFNNPSIPDAAGGDGSDIGAFEVQPANTMPGNNVTAEAPAGDATVTFHAITKAGFTTFDSIVPPSSAGAPPDGYTILESAPAYDIRTTATFTAPLTVCFTVSSITDEAKFARVRVLHGENGKLVDRTDLSSIDFANHTVCAAVELLSPYVVALAPELPNRLQNISTRLRVETGDNVLIGGFIVLGTDPKTVILRAIGPSLADFGVTGALADPILELHGGDGALITSNDNWKTTQKDAIIATGIPPTDDKESAIIAELEPGNYTLVVKGKNGGTGVGLVEAYDLAGTVNSEFANISTRGKVGTGTNVLIGGFILGGGTGDNTVLVRALGPSLGDAGVSGALADPTLELRDQDGALVRSNDNWKDTQMAAILATGIPPTNNLESALVQTLGPGNYTAIVAGKDGGIGVGLVEAYRLQ